jgi:hypothetical protein
MDLPDIIETEYTKILPIIHKVKQEHKGEDWIGKVGCPICKEILYIVHSKCNGHVWSRCGTFG